MIQLLDSTQDFDAFEIPDAQTFRRQTLLAERPSKQHRPSPNPLMIQVSDPIADYRQQQRKSRFELICSSVVAIGFGLVTIAIGYFLVNGV